jgi:transcriptional repressor NrdR
MKCPYCKNIETKVVDSRDTKAGNQIRRRRECLKCSGRFSTYEEPELYKLLVYKKNGERENFSREKLERGLWQAFGKRPNAQDKIDKVLDKVESSFKTKGVTETTSREIGNKVLALLKTLDEVAYIRFASVYKSFGSVKAFRRALESLEDLNE